jgi:DNA-directed RNA polymerase specialized sigma24 family protein
LRGSARQLHIDSEPTEEGFAKFLACLDPDPARAGEKYEELREALVKFLDWRGALFPEELVDEAFNRVTRELEEGETIRDVPTYCHGVARMVFLQSLQHPGNKRVELQELSFIATQEPDLTDVRREYLNHCLRKLSAENRELIIEYYRKEGRQKNDHRVAIAERLGIPMNALRSRAQRIRDKLERCVRRRLKEHNLRPEWKRTPHEG